MTSAKEYDCIVIGAGVHGSFTAYELAKKNKKTLLLEQVQFDSWDFVPEDFDKLSRVSSLLLHGMWSGLHCHGVTCGRAAMP